MVSKKFLIQTKEFWQQYYPDKELTDEDALEIFDNITGYFNILIEWDLEERRKKENEKVRSKEQKAPEPETQREVQKNRLIPVTKWNDYYDYPSIGGLRQLIFSEHKNGFNKVIRRIGGRVLIKEDAFFEWVEEINS